MRVCEPSIRSTRKEPLKNKGDPMQALKEAVDININKLKACETDAKVSRKDKIVVDPGQE